MNQLVATSYLHTFDLLETCLAEAARSQAVRDVDTRDTLAPLLHLDSLDHNELFRRFERSFASHVATAPRHVERPADLDEILRSAAPLSLLVLALHLKLVTQPHYLACVQGDESLDASFVKVLKEHWESECGRSGSANGVAAIQRALVAALPGRAPAALRDYRRIVFAIDDVLHRQSARDVETFEALRGGPLSPSGREELLAAHRAALRKTFLTFGIVNTAFIYSMRSLGPSAPDQLAALVTALSAR